MPGIWYKVHARSIWNTTSLPWEVSSGKDIEVKANPQHELNQLSETGMLLPGKYSEMRMKPKEKYEVINLRTCWFYHELNQAKNMTGLFNPDEYQPQTIFQVRANLKTFVPEEENNNW